MHAEPRLLCIIRRRSYGNAFTSGALYRRLATLITGSEFAVRKSKAVYETTVASHDVYTTHHQASLRNTPANVTKDCKQ